MSAKTFPEILEKFKRIELKYMEPNYKDEYSFTFTKGGIIKMSDITKEIFIYGFESIFKEFNRTTKTVILDDHEYEGYDVFLKRPINTDYFDIIHDELQYFRDQLPKYYDGNKNNIAGRGNKLYNKLKELHQKYKETKNE